MSIPGILLVLSRALSQHRSDLALENLALRRQLAVLHRTRKRPRFQMMVQAFELTFSRTWKGCDSALLVVRPGTALRWRR